VRLDRARRPLVDTRVIAAARSMMRAHGAITVDAAAATAATSGRHLERLFLQQVGTTPKRFARVMRLQAAAADIVAAPAPAFAGISADRGFYDQAHMIREFTSLAGQSPAAFQRSLGALTRMMLG
jgi:transcriptional regulator GlxA family with amidase domain